tara:strand:- start:469 stop:738 length:270 start_codon:yes stop_codon:yes gene_type:complete
MITWNARSNVNGTENLHCSTDYPQASRQIGVTEHIYYRWRKEYGGLRLDQAKRFEVLEREKIRLKRLVAEKALDIQILRETLAVDAKNF